MISRAFSVKDWARSRARSKPRWRSMKGQDLGERNTIVVAVFQHSLDHGAFVRRGFRQRVDQRQRDLAFAQIAAHRLAQRARGR